MAHREQIRRHVLRALAEVAPDADLGRLEPRVAFRDQIEIDSLDFLNFVLALEKRLGVRIPETDYPRLSTLEGCLDHLTSGLAPAASRAAR